MENPGLATPASKSREGPGRLCHQPQAALGRIKAKKQANWSQIPVNQVI